MQVTLPDGTTFPRTGRLDFVAPSLDATTGTQEFRALFRNPDRLLVPGQFVRVRLEGFSRDSALAIPQRAVQQALGRQFVYVVGKGDTVAARDIQPGPWSGNLWIIDKGLNPGERVVVDGTQKAAPGRPVRPVPLAADTCRRPAGNGEAGSDEMTGSTHTPRQAGAEDDVHYFFIRRPVLAIVISVVVTLLGVFAIRLLPISRYPQITPPAVQVQATFPGATAEDVAEAVAAPIEAQLSGLQGLLYYSSANASDGTMSLQIYFDVNRSQDLAAVDVQNAVKLAEPQLPDAVRQNGITILKANTDILGVVALTSDDPRYDAPYLTNYMKLNIEDEIKRVPGIGNALTFGGLEFSMLIQLDPDRMAQLGITTSDVAAAVREQNVTSPAGRLGREPAPAGHRAHAAGDDARAAQDARAVRRDRGPRQGGRVDRPRARHRQGGARLAELRSGRPPQRQGRRADAALPASGRQRARGQGGRGASGWTSCRATSRRGSCTRSPSTRRRS